MQKKQYLMLNAFRKGYSIVKEFLTYIMKMLRCVKIMHWCIEKTFTLMMIILDVGVNVFDKCFIPFGIF